MIRTILLAGTACFALSLGPAASATFEFDLDDAQDLDAPVLAPESPEIRALALIRENDPEAALAIIDAQLETDRDDAVLYELRGLALGQMGQPEQSLVALNIAVDRDPQSDTAHLHRGIVLLALGQVDAAKESLERSLELNPDARRAHQRLGGIAEAEGRTEDAIAHYEKGIHGTPATYLGVRANLARLYLAEGRSKDAIELLSPWETQPDASNIALELLGEAHAMSGDTEVARDIFNRLTERGTSVRGMLGLAELQIAAVDLDNAERTLLAAQANFPEAAVVHFQLGNLYGARRDYDQALQTYATGLEYAPDDPALLKGSMLALYRAGRFEDAQRAALSLAALPAAGAQDHLWHGIIEEKLGDTDAAIAAYETALEREPALWIAANNLAVLLMTRDPVRAVELARTAADAANGEAAVRDTLGQAYLAAGRPEAAVDIFAELSAKAPNDATLAYRHAQALLAIGNQVAARAELERALSIDDPDFLGVSEARKMLSSL